MNKSAMEALKNLKSELRVMMADKARKKIASKKAPPADPIEEALDEVAGDDLEDGEEEMELELEDEEPAEKTVILSSGRGKSAIPDVFKEEPKRGRGRPKKG